MGAPFEYSACETEYSINSFINQIYIANVWRIVYV